MKRKELEYDTLGMGAEAFKSNKIGKHRGTNGPENHLNGKSTKRPVTGKGRVYHAQESQKRGAKIGNEAKKGERQEIHESSQEKKKVGSRKSRWETQV